MNPGHVLLAGGSVLLSAQAAYSAALMLYGWEDATKQAGHQAPADFEEPQVSFTILLPARHEEDVIADTIQRVADLNYPAGLVQVLIIIEAADLGTRREIEKKLDSLARKDAARFRLVIFDEPPINKPHGLNVGLRQATKDVVTIFDAEDEPHPDILNVVNTVIRREGSQVVQSGVQLMNYADSWFSALNVLEYFFWFKSRMHYHAEVGAVPLGGNTVFIERGLLRELGGWDQDCLTEDADIGMRLSAAGIQPRVIYSDEYVTREETPPTVTQLVKQRTRWNQGFLQVLLKKDWRRLSTRKQRWLAFHTLSFPLFHALTMLYLPVSIWLILFEKFPVLVAILSTTPFYLVLFQLGINLVGLREFTRAHHLPASPWLAIRMTVMYMPYQWLLGLAALRALWRLLTGLNGWEKTSHTGAHRRLRLAPEGGPMLAEEYAHD